MFFPALIAEHRLRQVLFTALRTEPRLGFFIGLAAAAGTESRIRCQVLAAVRALGENELLMPAQGAEFGLFRDCAPAFMAGGR